VRGVVFGSGTQHSNGLLERTGAVVKAVEDMRMDVDQKLSITWRSRANRSQLRDIIHGAELDLRASREAHYLPATGAGEGFRAWFRTHRSIDEVGSRARRSRLPLGL